MKEFSKRLGIRVAGNINLTPEVETVLREMCSSFSQVAIESEFGRGFSGSRTFRVRLVGASGKNRLPAVIKIAPIDLIQAEWETYQSWVEDTLPNIARLESSPVFPTGSQWGGLRYNLVGEGAFEVQSLHDYCREVNLEDLSWVLENQLFEIMAPSWWFDNRVHRTFQMRSDYDILLPVNLLIKMLGSPPAGEVQVLDATDQSSPPALVANDVVQLKGFVVTKVNQRRRQLTLNPPALLESYRLRLEEVADIDTYEIGQKIEVYGLVTATRQDLITHEAKQILGQTIDLSTDRLTLPAALTSSAHRLDTSSLPSTLPNPLLTYQNLLHHFLTVKISTVHGDLNLDNILVDPATRDVRLIDFATVRQGHVLHDLLRLETEVIITLLPPLLLELGLPPETIYFFYHQLHEATFRFDPITSPRLPHPDLEKSFEMVRIIRRMARKCLFDPDNWQEYYHGLIIYLLGALKYQTLKASTNIALPKQMAFWGAATIQHLLDLSASNKKRQPKSNPVNSITAPSASSSDTESPLGTMRPESKFYIERPADADCWQQVIAPHAATLFVQAPMQMGKSSLMRRMLYLAEKREHQQFAFIDFQKFTDQYLADEEKFFIELWARLKLD